MAIPVIQWRKSYYEDLGTQDEQGFYDYAYQYFLYEFQAPSGSRIVARRYAHEPARGNLFFYSKEQVFSPEALLAREAPFRATVVAFMRDSEHVTSFDYFSGTYQPLPPHLQEPPPGLADFIVAPVVGEG